jgi:hypothetical protein
MFKYISYVHVERMTVLTIIKSKGFRKGGVRECTNHKHPDAKVPFRFGSTRAGLEVGTRFKCVRINFGEGMFEGRQFGSEEVYLLERLFTVKVILTLDVSDLRDRRNDGDCVNIIS